MLKSHPLSSNLEPSTLPVSHRTLVVKIVADSRALKLGACCHNEAQTLLIWTLCMYSPHLSTLTSVINFAEDTTDDVKLCETYILAGYLRFG